MHAKTMEGLAGASMNMKMMNTPFRVYEEAERRGDTATMARAMGTATTADTTKNANKHPRHSRGCLPFAGSCGILTAAPQKGLGCCGFELLWRLVTFVPERG